MGRINQNFFYYGAILIAILKNNRNASPVLISNDGDNGQIYKACFGESRKECYLFFKYAKQRQSKDTKEYQSWSYSFSKKDKELLHEYDLKGMPIFIYLLGINKKFQESQIAVLSYNEYLRVENKQTVTIGSEPAKHKFLLFIKKTRLDAYEFPKNRIDNSFENLLEQKGFERKKKIPIINKKKKERDKIIYIKAEEARKCPIHHCKMRIKVLNLGNRKRDTIYFCERCKKMIIGQEHEKKIKELLKERRMLNQYQFENLL